MDEGLVRPEILGQRAVAANDGQIQAEFARDANGRIDAAAGD
jgi:hypothetical protein